MGQINRTDAPALVFHLYNKAVGGMFQCNYYLGIFRTELDRVLHEISQNHRQFVRIRYPRQAVCISCNQGNSYMPEHGCILVCPDDILNSTDQIHGCEPDRLGSHIFLFQKKHVVGQLDELLGTKLRALYQRKKGRDLFDLALALQRDGVSPERIVEVFTRYLNEDGGRVTRAMFEQNLAAKKLDSLFTADMTPLLASGQAWSFDAAYDRVWRELVGRLPGEPWKGA